MTDDDEDSDDDDDDDVDDGEDDDEDVHDFDDDEDENKENEDKSSEIKNFSALRLLVHVFFFPLFFFLILPASIILFVLCRKIPIQSVEWPYQSNQTNGLFNLNAEKTFFRCVRFELLKDEFFSVEVRILYTFT